MPRRSPNTGAIIQRASGRIAVRLPPDVDPSGRLIYGPRPRTPFTSREQAEAWISAEVRRLRAPPATTTADETLGAYLARWYDLHADEWPERTRTAYRVSLRRWSGIGDVRLGSLTRDHVQGALAELRRSRWQRTRRDGTPTGEPRPYSPRTLAHARGILHQALEDLIPDVLTYNPARLRRRGRGEQPPEQPVWSAEHAAAFLDVAERQVPQLALAFRLILRRGLRVGETVALEWSDVNERAGTLTIDETAATRAAAPAGPTKTRRTRDVPLSSDLLARLRAHRQRFPTTSPRVFTVDGRAPAIETVRYWWHRCVRLAQVPAITPKDGRATCATLLLDAGEPLPRVSQLLGHSNVAVTASHYSRVLKRRAEEVAQLGEQFDAALDRAAVSIDKARD